MRNYIEDAPPPVETELSSPLMEMSQSALLELLSIDESEVRLNRAGKLTRDQHQFVSQQMRTDQDGLWLLVNIFLGTMVLLAIIFLLQGLGTGPLLLGGGTFFAAFGAYAFNRFQNRKQDSSARVGKVTGDLRLIQSNTLSQWGLLIGNKYFSISEALAQKFDGYRMPFVAAYFTEGTNTLLSMEVIETEKRKNEDVDDEIEQPLDAWDKPKNRLSIEETEDTPADETAAQNTADEAETAASRSKRRF